MDTQGGVATIRCIPPARTQAALTPRAGMVGPGSKGVK